MDTQTLVTEARTPDGKGAARQLRMAGKIPAVLYGRGVEPMSLALSPKDLAKALSTKFGRNVLLKLDAGGERLAMVRELQIHPVTRNPLHVDLYCVRPDQAVDVKVPLSVVGRAKGVVAGGDLKVAARDLPVRTTPEKIPAEIQVDVTELDLNEAVTVSGLPLVEGVEVLLPADRKVVSVQTARKIVEKEEDEVAGAPAAAAGEAPAAS